LPNQLSGVVRSVDFLGTYCLAEVEVDRFEGQRLFVYYSLNQVHQYAIRAGSVVPFALRGERVRVFGAAER
jgi:iron(III) transport system ATP-binding protein